MKEKLKQLAELKKWFSVYFNTEIHEGFEDMTYVACWCLNTGNVQWTADELSIAPGEYCGECMNVYEKEDYTLIRYDDGCGSDVLAVFDNKNKT